MADVYKASWTDPAMTDYPLFLDKAAGDSSNVNGLTEVGPSILYNSQDFRDLLLCIVNGTGRVSESNFTITPTGVNTVTISSGFGFIQSTSQSQGTYFVRNRSTVTLTLPAYVSGTELYRISIGIVDRADSPSSQYPANYGWYFLVQDKAGANAASLLSGHMNIGVVQKTGINSVPTVVPWNSTTNPRNVVAFGREDVGSGSWINFPTIYNTWTTYGVGYSSPRYYRTNDGQVSLEGMLRAGASSNSGLLGSGGEAFLILPKGYQPRQKLLLSAQGRYLGTEKAIRVMIFPYNDATYPGYIVPYGGASTAFTASSDWVSIDGISFLAYENQHGEVY